MKSIFRFTLAIVFLGFTLNACAPQADASRPPLRLEWSIWPGYYPMAIAKEKGIFAKYGVQVDPILYKTSSDAIADISAGKVDGGVLNVGDALLASHSDNVRIVMVVDNSNGADQVVSSVVVTSPTDLKGKRIGVKLNTFGELFIRQMLKTQNISPSDVQLVDIDPEAVPNYVPGLIDAGLTHEPYTKIALGKSLRVIFDSSETPGLIPHVLVLRTEVVKNRPDDVKALIQAWLEADKYWNENQTESKGIVAKYTGMMTDEVTSSGVKIFTLDDNVKAFQRGADTTSLYYTAQLNLDFLIKAGDITSPLDVYQLIDPTFVTSLFKSQQ